MTWLDVRSRVGAPKAGVGASPPERSAAVASDAVQRGQQVAHTSRMDDASERSDAGIRAGPNVPRVRGIRPLVGCSLPEALDALVRRFERQRTEQPEAFEETVEEDGRGSDS